MIVQALVRTVCVYSLCTQCVCVCVCVQSQQRELTVRHAKESEREMHQRLHVQKDEYEDAVKRHLSFIDQVSPPRNHEQF